MADSISRQQRRALEREKAARVRGGKSDGSGNRVVIAVGVCAVVVLVIAALVVVKISQGSSSNTAGKAAAASSAVVKSVTSIPTSTFNAVGYQSGVNLPKPISGTPLTNPQGTPLVVYLGAEYCPYCAAERWAMVAALGRFGTFKNLKSTHSSSVDVDPSTPTFSFHKSSFTSPYVAFQPVEVASNKIVGQNYAPLDTPTQAQVDLFHKYNPQGAFPFVDFGNQHVIIGASYDPKILAGLSMTQIAAAMRQPSSDISKAILGTANGMTAAICAQTGGKPANVCSSSGVTTTAAHIGK